MYYQYWGMQKAPFDNVPDPNLYWSKNNSLEDAISEVLFAIEEGNDCLAVMTGEIGTGKTLGLRIILNELDTEKYRVAFVTNPDLSPVQFMREIIGQLKNKKITTHYKDQLMEEFNATLFSCANKGQKVVIFIDEANVMSADQLHQLRLMTNLQDNQTNMVIFVLAGQKELGKRLESKALENLYQRIGVYCRIKGLKSPAAVQSYLEHRIQICGGSPGIFTKEAYSAIWAYSHNGVPRLINKIAKLCLKAGETNQINKIEADVVHAVASMFEREKPSFESKVSSESKEKEQETAKVSSKSNVSSDYKEKEQETVKVSSESNVSSGAKEKGHEDKREPEVEPEPEQVEIQCSSEPAEPGGEAVLAPELQFSDEPVVGTNQSPEIRRSPETGVQAGLDPEMMSLIKGLPSHIRNQIQMMEDKQLNSLAGKMAIQCIQQQYPKNSTEDPVVVWDSIKGRIYSALKSFREPRMCYTA